MSRHFGGTPARGGDKVKMLVFFFAFAALFMATIIYLAMSSKSEKKEARAVVVQQEPDIKMVEVLVPIREISAGDALQPAMFRRESRPQISVTKGIIRDFEQLKGHYARSLIVNGQPLHEELITSVRPTTALSASIPAGFRAVTIRVDATSSVEGWARPGSIVDVMWTSRVRGQQTVKTIVENAKVLSAERQISANQAPGGAVPSTVTLLVTKEDAQRVQLASSAGALSLVLRGDNDTDGGPGKNAVTLNDLIGASGNTEVAGADGTLIVGGQKYLVKDGELELVQ